MVQQFRSGYVSIVGKTNAGKSTLLNSILGQKASEAKVSIEIIGVHT